MRPGFQSFFIILGCITLFRPSKISSQDINAILAIQQIDTMLYSGSKDNRINWVIQNRGSQFKDREEFTTLFRDDLLKAFEPGHNLEQVPYAQYRNFFNLYAYWWPDAPDDNNGWNFGIIQALRDSIFLPWAGETGWATFFSTTRHGGGGGAGLNRAKRVGDGKMYGMGWETFLHEFGHTMPGLLDEYSASGEWSNGQCWETPNTTGQLEIDDIPWRRWIEPGTPIPTPYTEEYVNSYGAFEGAMTNYFGCHRPSARGCYMGAGGFGEEFGQSLCSPCVQRVICYLYKYVDVIENPQPAENEISIQGQETITFSVDVIKPEPNTQQYRWILNGKVIASQVETVEVQFDLCDSYELIFEVLDTNTLVRYDPKFEDTYPKPLQRKVWYIDQKDVNSYSLQSTARIQPADCLGNESGLVEFDISGAVAPYSIYLDGIKTENPVTNLATGTYIFEISDAMGCHISQEIQIESELRLSPQICTALSNNVWTLHVEDNNYESSALQYLWSNGKSDPGISVLEAGTYYVDISTNTGCSLRKTITLMNPDLEMQVTHSAFATEVLNPTGRIYLDIKNGRNPYTIEWSDKINKDLTNTNPVQIISSGTTWGHEPWFAFDDAQNTKWLHAISENAYIGYAFQSPQVITNYAITSADDVPERDPKNWEFQGSVDGQNWVALDQQINHVFSNRYERQNFIIQNPAPYRYYRLYILQNYGDIATQIQELEIVGGLAEDEFVQNEKTMNQTYRNKLQAGQYQYKVKDANATLYMDTVIIQYTSVNLNNQIKIVQDGDCYVSIEMPEPDFTYYWFSDQEASDILHTGHRFRPFNSQNYYVSASRPAEGIMGNEIHGFAVTVAPVPEVIESDNGTQLTIVNPQTDLIYKWYEQHECGNSVHIGIDFSPTESGTYYATSANAAEKPEPIDPLTLSGLLVRMDASDLNGDLITDNPSPATSSVYGWTFSNGNKWADNNWFAYRSGYQNGLGIADFATIWLQRIDIAETAYQTILMVYKENPLSFPQTAPFEGLSKNIPRHTDASRLYGESVPDRTRNGTTYLNGQVVDPLATANPMEFCVLGTVMTEKSNHELFYTDTHWEGKIGEILLFDRALSDQEMKGVSEFLKQKWIHVAELESPAFEVQWDVMTSNLENSAENMQAMTIYPNPVLNQFKIEGPTGDIKVEILDLQGKLLKSFPVGKVEFEMGDLASGMYIVRVSNRSGSMNWAQPLIKE